MKQIVQNCLVALIATSTVSPVFAAERNSTNSTTENTTDPTVSSRLVYQAQLVDHQQQPITNARINVRDHQVSSRTDQQGNFSLNLPSGDYIIDIEAGSRGHFHQAISVTDSDQPVILHLDPNHQRKVVITANPLEHTKLDMAAPAIVLSGDELIMKR